ncbi:MAG: hypothetical protein RR406_02760 [Bacilli bacterium]
MKFIHKNKATIIVIIIFIIFVILGAGVYNLLVPNSGKAIYGNRLEGKEKVKIGSETYTAVTDRLKKEPAVSSATTDERGRLVNILITVKGDTASAVAKALATGALEPFSNEAKAYFDFQIIISTSDDKNKSYPIFAYKHHTSNDIVWTKDRMSK